MQINQKRNMLIAISLFLSGCTLLTSAKINPTLTEEEPVQASEILSSTPPSPAPISSTIPVETVTLVTLDEKYEILAGLYENNGGCQLPCWWGITPGKTSWQETETLLGRLGATIKQFQNDSGGNRYGVRLLGLPELNLSFYDNGMPNSKVDKIFVSGNDGGGQDQREFEVFWESYSPKEVMSKYGVPSRILLGTLGTLGNTDIGIHGYTLWIFYDSLGFMIRYDGFIPDEKTFKFCFNLNQGANDIIRIALTLQHQDYSFPLESDDSILSANPSRGIPFQDITGISIEGFHQLFTQVEKPYCLETPHDIWPTR